VGYLADGTALPRDPTLYLVILHTRLAAVENLQRLGDGVNSVNRLPGSLAVLE